MGIDILKMIRSFGQKNGTRNPLQFPRHIQQEREDYKNLSKELQKKEQIIVDHFNENVSVESMRDLLKKVNSIGREYHKTELSDIIDKTNAKDINCDDIDLYEKLVTYYRDSQYEDDYEEDEVSG